MNIIALSGKARSGKDTLADHFHVFDTKCVSFAEPLKNIVSKIWLNEGSITDRMKIDVFVVVKSTDLQLFIEQLPRRFQQYFNHPKAQSTWNLTFGCTEHEEELTMKHSVRSLLQKLGTDFARTFCDQIWLDIGIALIEDCIDTHRDLKKTDSDCWWWKNIVVTDARFKNERDALRKLDAKLVYINRPSVGQMTHASENDLQYDYDFVIDNDGTIEEYNNKCIEFVKQWEV